MRKIDLGQTVQIIANLGVIGGIILLAYEVNQNSDAIRLQAAQSNLDTFYALDLLIAGGGIEDQLCLLRGRLQCVSRRFDFPERIERLNRGRRRLVFAGSRFDDKTRFG